MNLSKDIVTRRIRPDGAGYTVAAGSTGVDSDIVDTAGYEGVRFIMGLGAIVAGAVTSAKLQQNSANSGAGMADLEGSKIDIADTDDNKIVITEIYRPRERYVRLSTSRATQNATIDFLLVELYGTRRKPITEDSSVVAAEVAASPGEGTA